MKRSILALVLLVVACHGESAQRLASLESAPARRLIGVWDATFWLDRQVALKPDAGTLPRRLTGALAFVEDHSGGLSSEDLSDPTHVGVYDVDFRRFGFELGGSGVVPTVVARTAEPKGIDGGARDSVQIVVGPGAGRDVVRLLGVFAADTIIGVWTTPLSLGGGGRFVLRRHPGIP
jgi:hypothetical protein